MIHQSFLNPTTLWQVLPNEQIFGNIHNLQYTARLSSTIDALTKANCTPTQIYSYFQNLGINIYEEHIILYLKYGITNNSSIINLL